MQKAIIYCRVSSQRQVEEGHGNQSQEQRCRQYAESKGYMVIKVFPDEAISGGLFERPGMIELLKYLDNHPTEKYIVIFDDLSRFARKLEVHLKLRTEFKAREAKLECLNFNFDETPEGIFIENVLASKSQLDREQNRRQVIQKMKARLEVGYWSFCNPPGLKFEDNLVHGRLLGRKEPYSTIFKEVIEQYRDGVLPTLEHVQDFINKQYIKYRMDKHISLQGSKNVLTNILYAGWIEYKPWGVPLQKAKHEGFISKETYDAVQARLQVKSKAPQRRDYHVDFPLRGFLLCHECKKPMTASWNTGRSGKKYPHYFCKQWGCPRFGRTVRKEVIEPEFKALIADLTPNRDVLNAAKAILNDIWLNRDKTEEDDRKSSEQQLKDLEAKKRQFMDRISKTTDSELIIEYEKQVQEIIKQQKELEDNLPIKIYSQESFGTALDIVMRYLENPVRMWQSENYKDKRLLLEMYFEEKLAYDLKEGFGTATLACLPKLLCIKEPSENDLVEMGGVEPPSEKTLV